MRELREVTDQTFDAEVLRAARPVLVEYWAPWCRPCRQLEPILVELANRFADRMDFVRIDTAENPIAPADQQVLHLPTVQIFADGQPVHTFRGSKPKNTMRDAIEATLGG
ncbi:thioredoxin family protein [Naumannella halotolerans]|uniref:Thioredoxin n=1 Tax=Naumannella halotolerans TaxID=993414 RepID=A0A4V3EN13_9ACTN|nr:thioredoxin domain-containing protein [Naumannella halotolerans]TDT30988.1 thioredoxin 1 [Naumannella halotolerans]